MTYEDVGPLVVAIALVVADLDAIRHHAYVAVAVLSIVLIVAVIDAFAWRKR